MSRRKHKKQKTRSALSLYPLNLEMALRDAMKVDPKKIKATEQRAKKKTKKNFSS
jgi:hypothetical protein